MSWERYQKIVMRSEKWLKKFRESWELCLMLRKSLEKNHTVEWPLASVSKYLGHLARLVRDHRSDCLCVTAQNGELWKRVHDLERKTFTVVAFAKDFWPSVTSVNGDHDALPTKCEDLALVVQYMSGLAEEVKGLRACVAELAELSRTKVPKILAKSRIANMEIGAKQARIESIKHTAENGQWRVKVHELKKRLHFPSRRNIVADSLYSVVFEECDSLKHQVANERVCGVKMVQRLANGSRNVDVSSDDSNLHAVHAKKAIRDSFFNKFVALPERLSMVLQ